MRIATLLFGLLLAFGANAALVTETVEYRHGGQVFKGYLAYDDTHLERRPGILVVPEWWGINDYVKARAEQLADMGYLAFVVDMYGDGRVTDDPKRAAQWAGQVRGTPLMRERIVAGLEVLRRHALASPQDIAAIGFCFGGGGVLELAYSGADVRGVVSFHGNLPALEPRDAARIKARVLVLHGADDPFVKAEEVVAFVEGMRRAKTDWHMVVYGNAVHAFTNPDADTAGIPGVAYNELAAERAWGHMQDFFAEIFTPN